MARKIRTINCEIIRDATHIGCAKCDRPPVKKPMLS